MITIINKKLFAIVFGVATFVAPATTLEFTYMPGGVTDNFSYDGYGFEKKETYDAAIRICSPTYVGAKVTALRVPVPVESEWVTDVSGWLSTELQLENRTNVPNITSQSANVVDRMLVVNFDEPYTITEEGVYVGYSLTVTELGDYSTRPIACVHGTAPDGFYIHTNRTRMKWTDIVEESGHVSAMIVTLEMESGDTDVAVSLPETSYAVENELASTTLSLVNYGKETLETIGYSWNACGLTGEGEVALALPIAPGESGVATVSFGPLPIKGIYELELTVDKFNGKDNMDPRRQSQASLKVLPFMPVTRPLVEEYTGLLCQYCPRGYVAMEQMSQDYGERFVGLAYHTQNFENGCMVVMPDSDFPVQPSGYPFGTINRAKGMDPGEIPAVWNDYAQEVAPANLNVSIEWEDDSHTALKATVSADFAMEFDNADMALSLAIVADGLQNSEWKQINAFAGAEGLEGPLWDIFTQGSRTVSGLTFNDVVVYYKDIFGVEGSIPSVITFDTHPEYSFAVNLEDIKNIAGENFINPEAKLYAVGVLINRTTGYSLNANKSVPLSLGTTDIEEMKVPSEIIAVEWYDMQGRHLSEPTIGQLLLRVEYYADGTRSTKKVHIR